MPLHLYEKVAAIVGHRGGTINSLIRDLLWEWIEAQERKAADK
jgi:hypothetical protein